MSLSNEEAARLHNVVCELGPAIVAQIMTAGGGDLNDFCAITAGLLAVIVIQGANEVGKDTNPDYIKLLDIIAGEARLRLLSR